LPGIGECIDALSQGKHEIDFFFFAVPMSGHYGEHITAALIFVVVAEAAA
jgi:hypothetical protein